MRQQALHIGRLSQTAQLVLCGCAEAALDCCWFARACAMACAACYRLQGLNFCEDCVISWVEIDAIVA